MDDDRGGDGGNKKRVKPSSPAASLEVVGEGGSGAAEEESVEETGASTPCSEEMEVRIGQIFERMEHFTEQAVGMLNEGKMMFKDQCAQFEQRVISTHREQMEKWEEEIRELRLLDAANEEASALLQKARHHLLQNVQSESVEETGASTPCSEEMEVRIGQIVERMEHFTRQVARMHDEGGRMFRDQCAQFEQRVISTHREQMEKWEEEIRELRLLDAANEEASALLQKARHHLLQNVQSDF